MSVTGIISAMAVYFVAWWICLFAVLPLGVSRTSGEKAPEGADPGAPHKIYFWRIILLTSILSAVISLPLYYYWNDTMEFLSGLPERIF
jgi:predicted secreted protein